MNRINARVATLFACCAAALLMPLSFASATDASYGSGTTLIETGVDLGEYVESGTAPPLALDAAGSAWIVITKGRANPAL